MDTEIFCPSCGTETEHVILAKSRDILGKCSSCGLVHRTRASRAPQPVLVKTIVSEEQTSRICSIEFQHDEICRVGDRLVAACGDDYTGVEVTAIERGAGRVPAARSQDISAIWTRKIEEVTVRVSIHDGKTTTPLMIRVPGEEQFVVGETYRHKGRRFKISHMKLRDGAVMRKEGWKTVASRLKRIYAYPL